MSVRRYIEMPRISSMYAYRKQDHPRARFHQTCYSNYSSSFSTAGEARTQDDRENMIHEMRSPTSNTAIAAQVLPVLSNFRVQGNITAMDMSNFGLDVKDRGRRKALSQKSNVLVCPMIRVWQNHLPTDKQNSRHNKILCLPSLQPRSRFCVSEMPIQKENAWPVPVRPKDKMGDESTILLYLADFSTHKVSCYHFHVFFHQIILLIRTLLQNLKRIFYFTFQSIQDKVRFVEVVDPLFNQIIGGGDQVDDKQNRNDGDENADGGDTEAAAAEEEGGGEEEEEYDDDTNKGTQTWPEGYVLTKWW